LAIQFLPGNAGRKIALKCPYSDQSRIPACAGMTDMNFVIPGVEPEARNLMRSPFNRGRDLSELFLLAVSIPVKLAAMQSKAFLLTGASTVAAFLPLKAARLNFARLDWFFDF